MKGKKMKKIVCCIVTIIMVAFSMNALCETLITYGGTFSKNNDGLRMFELENPNTYLSWSDAYYYPASAFVTALLTREFKCDIFIQGTDQADWPTLMEKGFCMDLSSSVLLTDTVQRMYPNIASQAMFNGHLFAIPARIDFRYYYVNEETWLNMGYTMEEVPQSFSEFIDFLTLWCERIEEEPEANTVAMGGWDSESYSAGAYIARLAEILVNEVIMQQQYAEQELSFNTSEIVELLEKCIDAGTRLYKLESKNYSATLFEQIAGGIWPSKYSTIVFFRLNESQPKLIESVLSMWAINSNSTNAEKAIELLEKAATVTDNLETCDDLFIFQDAQPRISENYSEDLLYWKNQKEDVILQLQSKTIDFDTKEILESNLQKYVAAIERTELNKWKVSPEQLQEYQKVEAQLYFPKLNLFEKSAEGYEELQNLCKQFGYHKLNVNQFLQRLDRIAEMMRLEEE